MSDWPDLSAELDAWRSAGRCATFWWRDDDAVEPSAPLDRLFELARRHRVPLMLAVIPARATVPLARSIADAGPRVVPVQHGFAHLNHAPAGTRKCELGAHRPLAVVMEELARGRARMAALFADTWLPVMVPPWDRIAPEVTAVLGGLGYDGLSASGPRAAPFAAAGLVQVNAHADIMRWDPPRGFLGAERSLKRLIAHLAGRRLGAADAAEPTGLLTHHLAHDAGCWDFLDRLLDTLSAHSAVAFVDPRAAFTTDSGVIPDGTRNPAARGAA